MSDARRVVAFINGPSCEVETKVSADSSLIRSGLMDSLALFQLTLWIEAEVGAPLNLDEIEIGEAWDTPADIARFIETTRNAGR